MARVPQYQQSNVNLVSMPRVTTNLSGIPKGISAIGQSIATRAERVRKADQQTMQVKIDREFSDLRAQSMDVKGRAALDLEQTLENNRDALYDRVVGDIEDPITSQNIDLYFDASYNKQMGWTQEYSRQQEDVYLKEVDVLVRGDASRKLNVLPIGSTDAIDVAVNSVTQQALAREGQGRMSPARQIQYKQASTDQFYSEQAVRWYKESPDLAYKWFEDNKDKLKEKLSPAAYNKLATLNAQQYDSAETFRIIKESLASNGGNSLAATIELSNPANFAKYGITDYRHAQAAMSYNRSAFNIQEAMNDKQKKDRLNAKSKMHAEWFTSMAQMTVAQRAQAYPEYINQIRTDTDLTVEQRTKLLDNMKEANFNTDPTRISQIKDRIDTNEITEPFQIRAELGTGIGDDTTQLENYLKSKKKLDAEGNTDYMKLAERAYKAAVTERSNPKDIRDEDKILLRAEEYPNFHIRLEAWRKAEGLTANDPKIMDKAYDLMTKKEYQDGERKWWGPLKTKERYGYQEPQENQTATGGNPPAQQQPAPQQPAQPVQKQQSLEAQMDAIAFPNE